jgi:uncharacterized Ntn-hydrolase superfamily protein
MLLKCGATPQQAVDILLNGDEQSHKRQFALVDRVGQVAAYTGPDLQDWEWTGRGGRAAAGAAPASLSETGSQAGMSSIR